MNPREPQILQWLINRTPHPNATIPIGDDMGALRTAHTTILLASDLLLEGVHFTPDTDAQLIGRKAVARNLSDAAAMAVRPLAVTVSLVLPRHRDAHYATQVLAGAELMASAHNVALLGGDTATWDGPLVVDVALAAEPYPNVPPVRRSGANPGDLLLVTGTLGGSIRGKHLAFMPRVDEAFQLASKLGEDLHAMMDISDGLAADLPKLCEASGVGARLLSGALLDVASHDAHRVATASGRELLDHILQDGEDYELLMAINPTITDLPKFDHLPLHIIGEVVESGLWLVADDGQASPFPFGGYQHH